VWSVRRWPTPLTLPPRGTATTGYRVASHWTTTGRDGVRIVQYRLERIPEPGPDQPGPAETSDLALPLPEGETGPVTGRAAMVQRQVRSSGCR
jgi:hypothetical protein